MPSPTSTDCLIIGGGIIGLSIAYELASAGQTVRLVERGRVGRQASWAGAGMLPPGSWFSEHPALEALAAACHTLHPRWSARLREESGVDDEYIESGALYAITPENQSSLQAKFDIWQSQGIESQRVASDQAQELLPEATPGDAFFLPSESHVRNPRRLEALRLACLRRGVQFEQNAAVHTLSTSGDQITSVVTPAGQFTAKHYCLAAGAWNGELTQQLGLSAPMTPIRGQMLLLRMPRQPLNRIYHADGQYLVPRQDGRVLVGSTVEEAGFDQSTIPADLEALHKFACRVAPCLREAKLESSWAGLRPASSDAMPLIGRAPNFSNGWVAGGHFRSGLQFAPATAIAMRQLLMGEPVEFDIEPFLPSRFH